MRDIKADEIKKLLFDDIKVGFDEKLVYDKTGFEQVFYFLFLSNEVIFAQFAQYDYLEEYDTSKKIYESMIKPAFTSILENNIKYDELNKSLWKRIKFIFKVS